MPFPFQGPSVKVYFASRDSDVVENDKENFNHYNSVQWQNIKLTCPEYIQWECSLC